MSFVYHLSKMGERLREIYCEITGKQSICGVFRLRRPFDLSHKNGKKFLFLIDDGKLFVHFKFTLF